MEKVQFAKVKPYIFEVLFYLATFIISLIFYIYFEPIYDGNEFISRGEPAKILALVLLVILGLVVAILVMNKKFNRKALIFTMIVASFIIRLGYVLYTEGIARQYDTWDLGGHAEYAMFIYQSGKLPPINYYQLYHPPLNAFVQAKFMTFFRVIFTFANKSVHATNSLGGMDLTPDGYFWACQLLSLLYTTVISVTLCKIFKKLKIDGIGGIVGIFIMVFFPRFIQLSGQLNNDIMCIMFCTLALSSALSFYQNQSYPRVIALAIFVGLAIMTKLNGAIICLPIGVIMLMVLIKTVKAKEKSEIVQLTVKYATFLVICAPLALWFSIYAKIRFGQDFLYVFKDLNGQLSTADYSAWSRFFVPSIRDIFKSPFANAWEDYNLWDYMIKSSLFGEFTYWNGTAFAYVAMLLQYAFHLTFIVSLVFFFYHRKFEQKKFFDFPVMFFVVLSLTLIGSQIVFYIRMPYGCTMDFRYVVLLVLGYGGMTAVMVNDAQNTRLRGYKTLSLILAFFGTSCVLLSNIFYLVCV